MIISCGEALVDVVVAESPQALPGGGPMNVAITAARLGAPGAFVGRVSTDVYGKLIWNHLLDSGVVLAATQRGPEPTAVAYAEGDPPRWRFEGEGTADTLLLSPDFTGLGTGPHILHGGTLGLFREPAASILAAVAESHEGIVSMDPNVRPSIIDDRDHWMGLFHRWLHVTDVFKCSADDHQWIWPGLSPDEIATTLLDRGVAVVMITHGANGSTTYIPGASIDVPGSAIDVVDTVGSGDAFIGTVLTELWRRQVATAATLRVLTDTNWADITMAANHVAAITTTRAGADPPFLAELRSLQE